MQQPSVYERLDKLEREVARLVKIINGSGNPPASAAPRKRRETPRRAPASNRKVQVIVLENFNDQFVPALAKALKSVGCTDKLQAVSKKMVVSAAHIILAYQVSGRAENTFKNGALLRELRERIDPNSVITAVALNIGMDSPKLNSPYPSIEGDNGESEQINVITLWTPSAGMMTGGPPTLTVEKNTAQLKQLCRLIGGK